MSRRAIVRKLRRSTVEVKPSRFGRPSRAEFYPIQTNPETSHGRLIFRANLGEEIYVVPLPLLDKSDIANIDVRDSSPGSILKKVEIILTQSGQSKVQSFISSTSDENPVALVWQNEAYFISPAKKLVGGGPITVADGLKTAQATKLQKALK